MLTFLYKDVLESIKKIQKFTKGITLARFKKDILVKDAVLRNLGVIGEAANHVSANVKKDIHDVNWKKVVGLRHILIHEYFGIDDDIIWDVIQNKLPELKKALSAYLK